MKQAQKSILPELKNEFPLRIGKTEEKVYAFIRKHDLFCSGETILVAVSGGGDSMALLHFLFTHRAFWHIQVVAAHLDHCLRPGESEKERQMVIAYCRQWGIPLFSIAVDIRNWAQKQGETNLESAARQVRYRFLRQTAKICGAAKICTAHHLDDQGETILMHLLRGSGTQGLCGMLPQKKDIVRPFLSITKEEILAYCLAYSIPYATDQSNFDPIYLRNRIRGQLLPLLKQYNPQISQGLAQLGDICAQENAYLEQQTALMRQAIPWEEQEGRQAFDAKAFLAYPLALQRRYLQSFFRKFQADQGMIKNSNCKIENNLSFSQIMDISSLTPGGQTVLPGGVFCRRTEKQFIFSNHLPLQQQQASEICYVLAEMTQNTKCIFPGFAQEIYVLPGMFSDNKPIDWNHIIQIDEETVFIPQTMGKDMVLRTRREGDHFAPRGMAGAMKLKKYFINEKIPQQIRHQQPLLAQKEKIFWVIGKRFGNMIEGNGKNRMGKLTAPGKNGVNGWYVSFSSRFFSVFTGNLPENVGKKPF